MLGLGVFARRRHVDRHQIAAPASRTDADQGLPTGVDRRSRRWSIGAALVATVATLLPGPALASQVDPSAWPATIDADPDLATTAHSLRVGGPSRFDTNLATALLLRGEGGYPFSTPDRTSSAAPVLAEARQWWGAGACPFAVIVVAADSPADTLAAAALSDPTDGSSEPRLQRSAAADPTFDPPGGFDRVDTDTAPVLITASSRRGATGLSQTARTAAVDLRSGGCTTAREAIIVGGPGAVPAAVDEELIALGYEEVFRVAGGGRFETAAQIALALGTEGAPQDGDCVDEHSSDGSAMGFYGNSVLELRSSSTQCQLLGRTVVLADGVTAADALAAAWWTSFWQVPVLLTGGGGSLPAASRDALQTLAVEHLVVLGGPGRIPDDTAAEAAALAGGAEVHRIAGESRYATSVEMAKVFGGWYPTGDGADFEGSMVCLAGSTGEGQRASGWPDALAAGPWCAAAGGAAHDPGAPTRALPPADGPVATVVGGTTPTHHAVPVLLTPPNSDTLAAPVAGLLVEAFAPGTDWCSGFAARAGCAVPGFVVAFGGAAAVPDGALRQAATLVSGQEYTGFADVAPTIGGGFFTQLDLGPVFASGGDEAAERACFLRDDLGDVRWLAVYDDAARTQFDAGFDVMSTGLYLHDSDGQARSPGRSAPACVRWANDATGPGTDDRVSFVSGVSLSGNATPSLTLDYRSSVRLTMSGSVTQSGPEGTAGADSDTDEPGGVTSWTFADDDIGAVAVTSRGEIASVTGVGISIQLDRGRDVLRAHEPDTFDGSLTISTTQGSLNVLVRGEAVLVEGTWKLRGAATFTGGTWNVDAGTGGFTADVDTTTPGDNADDTVTWRLDGLVG